jgi:hypothetical protein
MKRLMVAMAIAAPMFLGTTLVDANAASAPPKGKSAQSSQLNGSSGKGTSGKMESQSARHPRQIVRPAGTRRTR